MSLSTPVAFIIFNRPETTAQVFKEIRRARPTKLLVVADGPRSDRPGEAERCTAARAIIESVDWPCKVLKNYSNVNLGCKGRVSSGLDWVFNAVEEAIILEDDCLPHPSFFPFCEELLDKYRVDERIMMISGDNFQFGRSRSPYDYYFSRYVHIWGWASWRRAWRNYDVSMSRWPDIRDSDLLRDIFIRKRLALFWQMVFEKAYQGEVDTWDYQWAFACLINSGLAILPSTNLISNIGFGGDATHAISTRFASMATCSMKFPLAHPPYVIRNAQADAFTDEIIHIPTFTTRAINKARRLIRGLR